MADQIISQDDIDALLAVIRDGQIHLEKDSEENIMESVGEKKEKTGDSETKGLL